TDTDLQVIDAVFARMEAAHNKRDPAHEAELDAAFHMAIIEASHNVVMLHMMRSMFELLREGVFYNRQIIFRQRRTRDTLLDQHRSIRDALLARDPMAARAAVERHLGFVRTALAEEGRSDANEDVARQRIAREAERG
ncbi:MAG: FCD domain-containing protein, partial [Defluviimonas sp.]|nr:FCD domain-containing protein [Defluviimonas sp.]